MRVERVKSCAEVCEGLVAWLDDESEPAERASVREHLDACSRCRQDLEELQAVRRDLASALRASPLSEASTPAALASLLAAISDARPAAGQGKSSARVAVGGRAGETSDEHTAAGWRPNGLARAERSGRRAARRAPWRAMSSGWAGRLALGGLAAAGLAMALGVSVGRRQTPVATRLAGEPSRTEPVRVAAPRAAGGALAAADRDLPVPDELRQQPGRFLDLDIVRKLEKLRNLEAVNRHADPDATGGAADGSSG